MYGKWKYKNLFQVIIKIKVTEIYINIHYQYIFLHNEGKLFSILLNLQISLNRTEIPKIWTIIQGPNGPKHHKDIQSQRQKHPCILSHLGCKHNILGLQRFHADVIEECPIAGTSLGSVLLQTHRYAIFTVYQSILTSVKGHWRNICQHPVQGNLCPESLGHHQLDI